MLGNPGDKDRTVWVSSIREGRNAMTEENKSHTEKVGALKQKQAEKHQLVDGTMIMRSCCAHPLRAQRGEVLCGCHMGY